MRTNIDIDDATLEAAMRAGPFRTKKDAVDAGLKLLARQAAYREILKWRGKLKWEGDESIDWTAASVSARKATRVTAPVEPAEPFRASASKSVRAKRSAGR